MQTGSNLARTIAGNGPAKACPYYSSGPGNDGDPSPKTARFDPQPADREDLPYKVELWNESRTSVEQVLAVTANGSIGYAAYFAATREHPDRYVTLRHKNKIMSRSKPER